MLGEAQLRRRAKMVASKISGGARVTGVIMVTNGLKYLLLFLLTSYLRHEGGSIIALVYQATVRAPTKSAYTAYYSKQG